MLEKYRKLNFCSWICGLKLAYTFGVVHTAWHFSTDLFISYVMLQWLTKSFWLPLFLLEGTFSFLFFLFFFFLYESQLYCWSPELSGIKYCDVKNTVSALWMQRLTNQTKRNRNNRCDHPPSPQIQLPEQDRFIPIMEIR